jgi:hypothetical protein
MPLKIIEEGEGIKLEQQAPIVQQQQRSEGKKQQRIGVRHTRRAEKETFIFLGPEGCEWARKVGNGIYECAGRLTKEVYGEEIDYIPLRIKPGALVCADCDKSAKVKLVKY